MHHDTLTQYVKYFILSIHSITSNTVTMAGSVHSWVMLASSWHGARWFESLVTRKWMHSWHNMEALWALWIGVCMYIYIKYIYTYEINGSGVKTLWILKAAAMPGFLLIHILFLWPSEDSVDFPLALGPRWKLSSGARGDRHIFPAWYLHRARDSCASELPSRLHLSGEWEVCGCRRAAAEELQAAAAPHTSGNKKKQT